jgi:hypothetical protein
MIDALPRLKLMGFGGNNDTCPRRGLTGVSRPLGGAPPPKCYMRVYVAAFHVSATIADKGPHV